MILLVWLASCSAPDPEVGATEMTPSALLSRMSLDLRGVRPSPAELDRVEADPSALEELQEAFLVDDRFAQRIRTAYQEVLLTRSEHYEVFDRKAVSDFQAFEVAIGEEPLYLFSEVAANDLPYTDLVEADWTVINDDLAPWYPTDYPADGTGWKRVHYTDGRPAAGILTTNGLYWRYPSTASNKNRKRANAISRILSCRDFLQTEVTFDPTVDLLDEAAIDDAIATNPACVMCHEDLDPIASYTWGFYYFYDDGIHLGDATRYHPSQELDWIEATDRHPAWYGKQGDTLEDLARQIEADPRFLQCGVEHLWTWLMRREPTSEDHGHILNHAWDFAEGGLTIRAAIRSIQADPWYRAGAGAEAGGVPTKLVTPEILASQVQALTGFHWVDDATGSALMASDEDGLLTLAGGLDGSVVTHTASSPNAAIYLVQERLAEAAASHVVQADAALAVADRRLFHDITFSETPETDTPAMIAQLTSLRREILGQHASAADLTSDLDLWQVAGGTPAERWVAVLSALLRDPSFVYY